VLNPVVIQVLQLHLVVVQQPSEERMDRRHEAPFMEVDEGDDVPQWWHRLPAGNDPLLRRGERA
jgi:hypothetical protein